MPPLSPLENRDHEVCMGGSLLSQKKGLHPQILNFRLEQLRQRGYGVVLPSIPYKPTPIFPFLPHKLTGKRELLILHGYKRPPPTIYY